MLVAACAGCGFGGTQTKTVTVTTSDHRGSSAATTREERLTRVWAETVNERWASSLVFAIQSIRQRIAMNPKSPFTAPVGSKPYIGDAVAVRYCKQDLRNAAGPPTPKARAIAEELARACGPLASAVSELEVRSSAAVGRQHFADAAANLQTAPRPLRAYAP
jgi:hypothetical protein